MHALYCTSTPIYVWYKTDSTIINKIIPHNGLIECVYVCARYVKLLLDKIIFNQYHLQFTHDFRNIFLLLSSKSLFFGHCTDITFGCLFKYLLLLVGHVATAH